MNGLDFSKAYSEDFSIHCIENTLDPLDTILKPTGSEFKWDIPPNAQSRVDYNAQSRVWKCTDPVIIQLEMAPFAAKYIAMVHRTSEVPRNETRKDRGIEHEAIGAKTTITYTNGRENAQTTRAK